MPSFTNPQVNNIVNSLRVPLQSNHLNMQSSPDLKAALINHAVTGETDMIHVALKSHVDNLNREVPSDDNGKVAQHFAAVQLSDSTVVTSHDGPFKGSIESAIVAAKQDHASNNANVASTRNIVNFTKGTIVNGMKTKIGFANFAGNGPSSSASNHATMLGIAQREVLPAAPAPRE